MLMINDDLELAPFSFTFRDVKDLGHRLVVTADVLAIEDGEAFQLSFSIGLPECPSPQRRAKLIRSALLKCLAHELNECLLDADGNHVVDPHPQGPGSF